MYEQIASNKRKTVLIVFGAFALLVAVGFALGVLAGSSGPVGLAIAVAVAAVLSFSSWRYGDRIVLASARAKPVTPDEEPRLHNIVEGLAIAAGVPKPSVYVIPEQALNAFATGRDPEHSSIAVTRGLLDAMSRVELEGVIGHEMAHVVDRDILLGTIVATLIGAVVLISEFMLRAWFWGGIGGRRGNDNSGGPAAGILALVGILLMILAPIAGELIKLSMSRNREYLADAQGALLTRYPPGLAAALRKIGGTPAAMHAANNATAHLWIATPSRFRGSKTGAMERLFETHPPLEERIRRLEEM
ncbi:MAG: M48 family metalloprotease [Actinomycetota bacterium]